jgi:hypothetical protein
MLIATKTFAALAFLISLGGIAMANSPEPSPQAPSVKSEQQPKGTLKAQADPGHQTSSGNEPAVGQKESSPTSEPKGHDQPNKGAHEASEFWTIGARSLKITDTLLVAFTFLLFLATLALFWATRDLVDDAKHNAERQLRAYVFPSHIEIRDFGTEKPTVGELRFKNSGQTPAYHLEIRMFITGAPFPLLEELPLKKMPDAKGVMPPGGEQMMTIESPGPLALEQVNYVKLGGGGGALYIWGTIDYVDAFDRPRCYRFLFFLQGNRAWAVPSIPAHIQVAMRKDAKAPPRRSHRATRLLNGVACFESAIGLFRPAPVFERSRHRFA